MVFNKVWQLFLQCGSAWNSLPDHGKNAPPLETFKLSQLKTYVLNNRYTTNNYLNPYTAPFPLASAVLQHYTNRLIIIILFYKYPNTIILFGWIICL